MAITSGTAPNMAAKVVIRIGRNRARQASWIARCGDKPQSSFAVQREIHHDDSIFLHDADEQDDPDEGDHRQFSAGDLQGEQRAKPR